MKKVEKYKGIIERIEKAKSGKATDAEIDAVADEIVKINKDTVFKKQAIKKYNELYEAFKAGDVEKFVVLWQAFPSSMAVIGIKHKMTEFFDKLSTPQTMSKKEKKFFKAMQDAEKELK